MRLKETVRKPMQETSYLSVENTDRYRSIMRLFYLHYENLKYWLYPEDIHVELQEDPYFREYTIEQCKQDLTSLVDWGNLIPTQDTRRVSTIEEFKNKKFRYQMTETSVEIERMVIRVENLFLENSSLEPTLMERIRISLKQMESFADESDEKLYSWWNDLNADFKRLNQNYQDYMRELNSAKAEELMQTKVFLLFKDRLIEYLRSFVKSLQNNASVIEQYLHRLDQDLKERTLIRISEYTFAIPRVDMQLTYEDISRTVQGRWNSLEEWFAAGDGKESEAARVFDATNEIIRKITRYAMRIGEQASSNTNRREEYRKMAEMFWKCDDLESAHRLSACVFGIERPFHFKGIPPRKTESINSGVFEEEPYVVTVTPRVRTYREKTLRSGVIDRSADKDAMRQATIKRLREERELLQSYIKGGRLDFAELPEISPHVRDVFLLWLSKALESRSLKGKTEDGQIYYIENADTKEYCRIVSDDGILELPAYQIRFGTTAGDEEV